MLEFHEGNLIIMSEQKNDSASHWKLISFLLVGILIPIVTSSMPWLLDNVFSGKGLKYTFQSPVTAKSAYAYSVTVKNTGRKTEENIEIWLPVRQSSYYEKELQPNGQEKMIEKQSKIIVETSIPTESIEQKDDKKIVKLKSLRPDESISITIFVVGGTQYLLSYELKDLRVTSNGAMAINDNISEEFSWLINASALMFPILFLLGLLWSIYYEYFMPRAQKEKYLLEQIDKLAKLK
ncbi:MAG TPA: hypothetical protein VIM59_03700 [Cellvibrio sp.]